MKKILVIEDTLEVRENIAEILELSDYEVIAASNGKEGVELAKQEKPDLIICDVMMPELDGFGVLHVLSKHPETSLIPFIFLTAKTEKADMRKGMNLGADDYITKPFDDVELLDAVEIRLRKNELIRKQNETTLDNIQQVAVEARGVKELEHLIADKRKTSRYKKKQVLYSEGNMANSLFFIVSGKVKTYKTNEDGREYIVGLHKNGDFIGYINLLEESTYTESAMAMEDTEICVVPKQEFFAVLYSNKDIAEKFIKMLSSDLRSNEDRLIKLAYNSVRKRVSESLLMLAENYRKVNEKVVMPVSREDLASITGASKETVIRTISDFKEEGLIEIQGSQITLLNETKLRNMRN
ncbi:MAG: response regulator [Cytophagaceae bacterium]|jgi:CRP-like cAMP-binding protein|nr:response regulator [Cytophagaceae bacterium]